jgi:hypothetical protein
MRRNAKLGEFCIVYLSIRARGPAVSQCCRGQNSKVLPRHCEFLARTQNLKHGTEIGYLDASKKARSRIAQTPMFRRFCTGAVHLCGQFSESDELPPPALRKAQGKSRQRGQVHVFGHVIAVRQRSLAEEWTRPRLSLLLAISSRTLNLAARTITSDC